MSASFIIEIGNSIEREQLFWGNCSNAEKKEVDRYEKDVVYL